MNNGTADCANFVMAMEKVVTGKANLVDEISDYEKEVIERGARETTLSKELTHAVHHWDTFMESPIMRYGGNIPSETEKKAEVLGKAVGTV